MSKHRLAMAKRVVGYVHEFDMLNLYGPEPLLDEIAEAGSGAKDVEPQKTLREHNYGVQPLIIRPDYSGDFLDKLRAPFEGKSIEAASDESLTDFSMPSEWLKHQEEPHPRILLDEWYDFGGKPGAPGEQSGYQEAIHIDRRWDGDAPEISEDLLYRQPEMGIGKIPTQALRRVLASYLMDFIPAWEWNGTENIRVAKTLYELEASMINGKDGYHRVKDNPLHGNVQMVRAEPAVGRWTFSVGASATSQVKRKVLQIHKKPSHYTVVFQFIPKMGILDTEKLDVKVVCDCDSFLYYGAQYHAIMQNYLYGNVIRPKVTAPTTRDKQNRFFACKHIVACIPLVSTYKIKKIEKSVAERLKKAPQKYKLHPGIDRKDIKEKIKIPQELEHIGQRPHIQVLGEKWGNLSDSSKAREIKRVTAPDELGYLAHKYPEASDYIVNALIKMAKESKQASVKAEAEKIVQTLI